MLDEDVVETRPEQMSHCILECKDDKQIKTFVDNHVKPCFTSDAWQCIEQVIETKRQFALWNCLECKRTIQNGQKSMRCDGCLEWIHKLCAGYKRGPRGAWFCSDCK